MVFNKDHTSENELHVFKFLPDSFEIQFEIVVDILSELVNISLEKLRGKKLMPVALWFYLLSTSYLILVHLYMSLGNVNPPSSCCCTCITNRRKQGIVGLSRDASLFINHELSVFSKT